MLPLTSSPFAAALLVLAVLPSATSGESSRCSLAPFPDSRVPDATYLLGTATPDTLLAGPGAVEPSSGPGHWGRGEARPIYGQIIHVERFGGVDSASLAQAIQQQDARNVVIVPWDYDPSCRPAIWSRSARWVPLGEPGMFTVRLRPRTEWADGLPTFDAFMADLEPYPLGVFFQRGYRGTDALRTHPSLTAAEYFEMYRALPDQHTFRQNPDGAREMLAQWERANPELARKYPAPEILRFARANIHYQITRRHLRSIEPPLAGTYRLTFSLAGGEDRTFYARTRSIPTSAWSVWPRQEEADPRQEPRRPEGYYLLTAGALSRDSLPADCERDREMRREGYIAVLDPPQTPGESRREWVGKMELDLLARQFPADSALAQFVRDEFERFRRRPQDLPRETPARFRQLPDGTLQAEQTIALEDGRTLVIEGERISPQTIACSW